MKMTGMNVTTRDEILANVVSLQITDTYIGQLAGTMTVGTRHRLPKIEDPNSWTKRNCGVFLTAKSRRSVTTGP